MLVNRFTQTVPQSVCPPPQMQKPVSQVWVPPHVTPHAPQLALLELRSTQLVPQSVCVPGQMQVPFWQVCVPTHAVPHAPQLLRLT